MLTFIFQSKREEEEERRKKEEKEKAEKAAREAEEAAQAEKSDQSSKRKSSSRSEYESLNKRVCKSAVVGLASRKARSYGSPTCFRYR